MKMDVDDEFRELCREIVREARSLEEWEEVEACDYFQTEHYCGGFECGDGEYADGAFWFSYYSPDGTEYWFEVSLNDATRIARGEPHTVELEPPK